jgi:hypothetical protein
MSETEAQRTDHADPAAPAAGEAEALRTETPDHRVVRLSPDEVRQGHIVLRRPWQKLLVLFVLPPLVLLMVVVALWLGT